MTNRKIKNYTKNMQYQIALREMMKNLMTLQIGLVVEMKESKTRVKAFDKQLDILAKKLRQDIVDDVFDVTVDRYLNSVNLTYEQIYEIVRKRCLPQLIKAKYNSVQLSRIQRGVAEDFSGDLLTISQEFGYGEKRIKRLLSFYENYSGDPLKQASELFGYRFAEENELIDFSSQKKNKEQISKEEAERIKQELEGLRAYQAALSGKGVL